MKILLGSSLYPPNSIGGSEKVVQALADEFVAAGHAVSVITTQPRGEEQHMTAHGASVNYVTVRNLYRPFGDFEPGPFLKTLWRLIDSYNFFMVPKLMRIIASEGPDVINTHNVTGLSVSIWTAAKRLGIPIVHTLHDQYLVCHRSTMFKRGKNCARQCIECRLLTMPRKRMCGAVDCVIGVSEFILRRHSSLGYFKAAKPIVIYNKLRPAAAAQDPGDTAARPLRFGFLGQIIPTKGLHELIAAYKEAALEGAELWIAGKGESPYALQLRQRTQHDRNIRWLGFVRPEVFFPAIDILVVPSLWNDTAPLVVTEAMNYGVPVLGSRRGGIPELMGAGTGWLYDPDAPHLLRTALEACSESRGNLSEMKVACLIRAKGLLSGDWAADYVSAYQAAIDRHLHNKRD